MTYTPEVDAADAQPTAEPLSSEPAKMRQRRRRSSGFTRSVRKGLRRVRWLNIVIVIIAVVSIITISLAALLADSVSRVETSLASLERVLNSVNNRTSTELTIEDFARISSSVSDLTSTLETTRSRLGIIAPVASLNESLPTTINLIEAAYQMASAGQSILRGLQPTLSFLVADTEGGAIVTQISSGERVVELLRVGRGQFLNARESLDNARQRIDQIDIDSVPTELVLRFHQMNEYYDMLSEIDLILINSPDILTQALGIGAERNYLVLSQNNDELRPSGGYISTYGWMTVRNGRVTDYDYSPTTRTSPIPPSPELAAQYPIPTWWVRYSEPIYALWDGSWEVDYPATAQMAIWYYNTGGNPRAPVHGAIAIDITGFEYLLAIVGDVIVPGYDRIVNAGNFREVIYDVRTTGEIIGDDIHKAFLTALYQEIFTRWQSISFDSNQNTLLLTALLRGLQEKHIMMYFTDPNLQAAIESLGWSGAQSDASADYLMVADANLGNKSNNSVLRQITLDVDVRADGSTRNRATVGYDYSARVAELDPAINPPFTGPIDYNNLTQIFVPPGSILEETTNIALRPTIVEDPAHTMFTTRFAVRYDSSARVQFIYSTPSIIDDFGPYQRYQLELQKQPGARANAVSVQVTLPIGASVVNVSPQPSASYVLDQPILEFRFDLNTDRQIEIIFRQASPDPDADPEVTPEPTQFRLNFP